MDKQGWLNKNQIITIIVRPFQLWNIRGPCAPIISICIALGVSKHVVTTILIGIGGDTSTDKILKFRVS